MDINDSLEGLGLVITAAQAMPFLQLDGTEPEPWLEAAVYSANAGVLDWLGWDPRSMTTTEVVDCAGGNALLVTRKKITAISAVNLLLPGNSEQSIPQNLAFFSFDQTAAIIYCTGQLPRGQQNIQVTYTAGYAPLPRPITQGILYTIKAMLDASGVDFNAVGESYSGVLNRTFWPTGPGVVPPSARTLLTRYQRDM